MVDDESLIYRDFQSISLLPGESRQVEVRIAGDNLQNLLVRPKSGIVGQQLGELHLSIENLKISLPGNSRCLLSSGSAARQDPELSLARS